MTVGSLLLFAAVSSAAVATTGPGLAALVARVIACGLEGVAPFSAFLGSLSLTLGNPKVMVFFLSIMPLVVDVKSLTPARLAELMAVAVPVIALTLAAYALAANRARALFRSVRAMRIAHRAAGGVMAGVAVAVATR